MNNYTFEDMIINPKAEGIEKYIGKEVYFGNTPTGCLYNANINNRDSLGILAEIHPSCNFPFGIDRSNDGDYIYEDWNFLCFIPKKEDPKPKYIPFMTPSQFISAYNCHKGEALGKALGCQLASTGGIWIKSVKGGFYEMITEVYENGIVTRTVCGLVSWSELYKFYVFPDNTPCGIVC